MALKVNLLAVPIVAQVVQEEQLQHVMMVFVVQIHLLAKMKQHVVRTVDQEESSQVVVMGIVVQQQQKIAVTVLIAHAPLH